MERLPEMQLWKAMMKPMIEPKDGVAGGGLGGVLIMERLRELLLTLSTLLQKLDQMLPAENPPVRPPHDHDGVILLSSVLLVAFFLASLVYFFFFFRGGEGGVGVGGWGETKALKRPRSEGSVTFSEHECMFAAIATLLFVVFSLGGLYYYYCYQTGCFGSGVQRVAAMVGSPGRKLRVLSG